MTETFKVFNPSPGPCSLIIYKPLVKEDGMAVHNYKRLLRSASIPVLIPARTSKDLAKETGLTISELKNQKDLHQMLATRKLTLLQEPDAPIGAKPVVEEAPIVSEIEKPVEVVEETVEEERVDEVEPVDATDVEEGREPTQVVKKHRGRPKKL